jgi:LemA protein
MIYVLIVILALIVIILLGWLISTGNKFKRSALKIDEALSGIEVALTKRFDTLTKMLDIAKGYAKHEQEAFTQVIALRKGMSVDELQSASAQLDRTAAQINAVAEGYPELRSSDVFVELQGGVRDAEEHLQAARRLYNSNVTAYNTAIVMYPASIIANAKHLKKRELFAADEAKKADVKMTL